MHYSTKRTAAYSNMYVVHTHAGSHTHAKQVGRVRQLSSNGRQLSQVEPLLAHYWRGLRNVFCNKLCVCMCTWNDRTAQPNKEKSSYAVGKTQNLTLPTHVLPLPAQLRTQDVWTGGWQVVT